MCSPAKWSRNYAYITCTHIGERFAHKKNGQSKVVEGNNSSWKTTLAPRLSNFDLVHTWWSHVVTHTIAIKHENKPSLQLYNPHTDVVVLNISNRYRDRPVKKLNGQFGLCEGNLSACSGLFRIIQYGIC